MELDEVQLWNRLLKGDKEVLEVLYKSNYNLLYNYGVKLCADRDLVKDFIQDIFLKLYKSDCIGACQSPRVYLLKAMRNTVFDYYSARKECVSIDELAFVIPEQDVRFDLFFSKSDADLERGKRLMAAISELSGQQRQVLYLHYIKNLSHKEISDILDMNAQSSMNSVSRALSKLRSILDPTDLFYLLFLAKFF